MRHCPALLLALLLLSGAACERLTPEQQLVHEAAEAIGGLQRVVNTPAIVIAGNGRQFNLGQDRRPGLAEQTFTVSAFERDLDLEAPRMRTTLARTPDFAYFQGPQAQTLVHGIDGDVAYNVNAAGAATRLSATIAAERRTERLHHPLVLLRQALEQNASLLPAPLPDDRARAGERAIVMQTNSGAVTFVLDADKRPIRIESPGTHPNLGDVLLTTRFGDYAEADGLRLPTRITTLVDDFTTADYTVTTRVRTPITLAAPPEARDAAAPGAPAVNVTAEALAPGVWVLAGQSHHSVVVAFRDRLVLIEAPQSEARSLAVIDKAQELGPNTPVTHLVLSHHHFDHSAGLRAAVARGLTVITQAGNADFVAAMAARPFTRAPDALSKLRRPVQVEPVGDTRTISDGTRSLVLYHVAGNPHSDTMLMAYLPVERLLIEVDAFSPGGTYHPFAANLLGHIERLSLAVDRVVPLHGPVVPMSDLVAAARPRP
jgi:glyoxylase-like metal-dependent hydrolase (beta-lactamase superfamily II)